MIEAYASVAIMMVVIGFVFYAVIRFCIPDDLDDTNTDDDHEI